MGLPDYGKPAGWPPVSTAASLGAAQAPLGEGGGGGVRG